MKRRGFLVAALFILINLLLFECGDRDITKEIYISYEIVDSDGDGIEDNMDNCPTMANPEQANMDGDDLGDACDDDADGDGYLGNINDCNDLGALIQPGIPELCDDRDNDCDPYTAVDDGCDDDNDGWCDDSMITIGKPSICLNGGGDCNDDDPFIYPGVFEYCFDSSDTDCDGDDTDAEPDCYKFLIPDTGISDCYDNNGLINCPSSGEAFNGQDAQYLINPMNFTDNIDGTVTDNVTGLMWQQQDDDIERTWTDAINYCDNLTLAGYNDWRLPDEYQLQSIVDYGTYNPAINTNCFPNTNPTFYWSSSVYAQSSLFAWGVYFNSGVVDCYHFRTDLCFVRCVRGNFRKQYFIDNGDGTVTDIITGLIWQEEGKNSCTWQGALAYCKSLTLAGYNDWRLPNIKELRSIVDNTEYDPAINRTYFPNTSYFNYWSASTNPGHPNYAWIVHFEYGPVFVNGKTNNSHVRCVRLQPNWEWVFPSPVIPVPPDPGDTPIYYNGEEIPEL